jgi:SnoaL-like domain
MPDLALRLARLEAIVAIQHVMFRYAECVDLARFEELGQLFRHGSLAAVGAEPMKGAQAIRNFYAATNKVHSDGTLRTRHLATNAIVEVEPGATRATARSYFVVLQETATLPLQAIVAGRYHDVFHVVAGEWTFAERLIHVDQVGDMSNHLSFDLRRDPIPKIG